MIERESQNRQCDLLYSIRLLLRPAARGALVQMRVAPSAWARWIVDRRWDWAPIATAVLVSACGCEEPPERVVVDLVERFAAAEIHRPTLAIDLGQPAARRFLVYGWLDKTRKLDDPDGRRGRWSTGDSAEIEFFVSRPAGLEMVFRCAPVRETRESSRELALAVNGSPWRTVTLVRSMAEYRLELPAELLRPGQNRLRIVHPRLETDAATSARKDVRILWDSVRFGHETEAEPPRPFARQDIHTVFIPFVSRIDYYLELPENSFLAAGEARSRGSSTGSMKVLWRDTDGEPEILTADFTASPDFRLRLTGAARRRGRLSLWALSEEKGAAGATTGIVLRRPRILAGEPGDEPGPIPELVPRALAQEGEPQRPNVIVYLVDTLRADHLGCYGYSKATSPSIDRFAREAVLFENSQAQSPWTRSSVASIFTGLWPQVHGANKDDDVLAENFETLAEALSALGYRTAAISGNGNAHRTFGFGQGFDSFEYLRRLRPGEPLATSADINDAVFRWLEEHSETRPFFLYIHTIDPHAPYTPAEPYRWRLAPEVEDPEIGSMAAIQALNLQQEPVSAQRVARLRALYDAEIAQNDASFGLLLDELERRDIYQDSLVVFLSDHGEEFYEHGNWVHGKTLYTEMLDVPLIIKLPRAQGSSRVSQVAQHVDVLPTVLDVVGGALSQAIQGRSLLPLLREASPEWPDRAVSHMDLRGRIATSLLDGDWKVIHHREGLHGTFPELYDRRRDRLETQNIAPVRPILAKYLVARLHADQAAAGRGLESSLGDDREAVKLAAELRALGYLE